MYKRNLLKKASVLLLAACMVTGNLAGCGGNDQATKADSQEASAGEKVFYYGDTTFNAENDESDVNPHNGYSGWACIRYGIGETLFKYSDTMELEPWLATEYELVDESNCMDVMEGNYRQFSDYNDYKRFILHSRQKKDKRYK